jgi:hypothetical protein
LSLLAWIHFPSFSAAFLRVVYGIRFAAPDFQPPTVNPALSALSVGYLLRGHAQSQLPFPNFTLEGVQYRQAGKIQHHEVVQEEEIENV